MIGKENLLNMEKRNGCQEQPEPNRAAMEAVDLALKGDSQGLASIVKALSSKARQDAARMFGPAIADPNDE